MNVSFSHYLRYSIALSSILTLMLGVPSRVSAQQQVRIQDSLQKVLEADYPVVNSIPGSAGNTGSISVAAVGPSGDISTAGFGFVNLGVAVTDSTLMGMADVSVHVLTILTLRMAEAGVLSLSDQIGADIFSLPANLIDPLVPTTTTIEQLLKHTSGINDVVDQSDYLSAESFIATDLQTDYRTANFAPIVGTYINPQGAASAPGTFDYGLFPFLVLALKLEKVGGSHIDTLLKTYVLDPVGLTLDDMRFWDMEDQMDLGELASQIFADLLGLNQPERFISQNSYLTSIGPATGLVASPKALMKLVRAVFEEGLLNQASLDQLSNFSSITGRASNGYSLGTERFSLNIDGQSQTFVGHVGTVNYRSLVLYRPEDQIGLVISSNLFSRFGGADGRDQDSMLLATAERMLTEVSVITDVERAPETTQLFDLYPVPTRDQLWISIPEGATKPASVHVFNEVGQSVLSLSSTAFTGSGREAVVSVKDLVPGVYVMRLEIGEEIATRKFIIQR